MKKIFVWLCAVFFFVALSGSISFAAETSEVYPVSKVVDGDTIHVVINNTDETVRLLGIDTPETVDPRKPVQCFGKAASDNMKEFVSGKSVILVSDPTQGDRDKYHRLLRFVYLPDEKRTFVNGEMVKQGYAFSYKAYPTTMLEKFNEFEQYAKAHNLGLWGACPLSPTNTKTTLGVSTVQPTTDDFWIIIAKTVLQWLLAQL